MPYLTSLFSLAGIIALAVSVFLVGVP
jgi:hypothetical protein